MSEHPATLYDLCEESAQAIESMPGNYWQDLWEEPVTEAARIAVHSRGSAGHYAEACGTAFCRAGWMVNLLESPRKEHQEISDKAYALFSAAGVPREEVYGLFAGGTNRCQPGTDEYAAAGAAGIRQLMAKHEDKLRAFTLDNVLDDDGTISLRKVYDRRYSNPNA